MSPGQGSSRRCPAMCDMLINCWVQYSALFRSPTLPLDALKIDRRFVANGSWEICEVIRLLTDKLKLNVLEEGMNPVRGLYPVRLAFDTCKGASFPVPFQPQQRLHGWRNPVRPLRRASPPKEGRRRRSRWPVSPQPSSRRRPPEKAALSLSSSLRIELNEFSTSCKSN